MKNIFKGIEGIRVLTDEPIRRHTSFRIGGKVDYLIDVYSQKGLLAVMELVKKRCLKYFVLGAGTNVLFADDGFRGVVIRLKGEFKRIENKNCLFIAGAGVLLEELLERAMKLGYGGAEFLTGIPGTLGGAIRGNAGAFGRSISEITKGIYILDKKLEIRYLNREELGFGYRECRLRGGAIILYGELKLLKRKPGEIKERMEGYLRVRRERQPVGYSAGSFFKNPLPQKAGLLIDECGLKGMRVGDAMVSEKHANFILNLGRAKAQDVLRLVRTIQRVVRKEKGIELKPEVKIVC